MSGLCGVTKRPPCVGLTQLPGGCAGALPPFAPGRPCAASIQPIAASGLRSCPNVTMDVDNENQDNQLPDRCTYDQVLWHVDKYSSLPPPVVLRTAPAEELGKIVDCVKLAPFLGFLPGRFWCVRALHHFIPALPPSRPSLRFLLSDDLLNSSPRLLWYADGMDEATAAPDKAARLEAGPLARASARQRHHA